MHMCFHAQLALQILNGIYRGGCCAETAAAGGIRAFWLLYLTLFSKKEALRNDGEWDFESWQRHSGSKCLEPAQNNLHMMQATSFSVFYLVQLIEHTILQIPHFNFPNLCCCKVFFLFNIISYIGIFGCIYFDSNLKRYLQKYSESKQTKHSVFVKLCVRWAERDTYKERQIWISV